MSENPFKVGEWIECQDERGTNCLVRGQKYRVTQVDTLFVRVDGLTARYEYKRFVSRPSEEWRNGDDVEWGPTYGRGVYVGRDPDSEKHHVIRFIHTDGTMGGLLSVHANELRRPKPARTLEQLLERLGEGWGCVRDGKARSSELEGKWVVSLRKGIGSKFERDMLLCEPTRQACIDAAWELLVKEDEDEADSAE